MNGPRIHGHAHLWLCTSTLPCELGAPHVCALPSVERLALAVPERLPTGNPEVDRLRAAWNEGRAAILAALRDEP